MSEFRHVVWLSFIHATAGWSAVRSALAQTIERRSECDAVALSHGAGGPA